GDWRLWFYQRERGKAVTSADVARAAKAYLRRDNRTVGRFFPTGEPERAPIQTPAAGEAFDPSPANIEARTRRYTLPNGTKVALLPKKTRGETVNLALRSHYGDEQSRFGKSTLENVAGAMLTRGTTRYTRSQLSDAFDGLKASGNIGLGNARMQTTRPNLVKTLELVAHVMREPTFPQTELDQLRKQWIAGLESDNSEPTAVSG